MAQRVPRETRPCAGCGTPLTRLVSQSPQANWYCGPRCKARHNPSPLIRASAGRRIRALCAHCGAPVDKLLSQVKPGASIYCSNRCKATVQARTLVGTGRWQRPNKPRRGETLPCAVCAAPVYANQRQRAAGEGKYCSRACHNVAQTKPPVVASCARCGAEMRLKPSLAQRRYCSRACETAARTKRPTGRTHNGRPVLRNAQGYLTVYEPDHPRASKAGRVLEHRLMVESLLGRRLGPKEHVHHIDRDKTNNAPVNLDVMDADKHSLLTNSATRARLMAQLDELARYRDRFGPLEP